MRDTFLPYPSVGTLSDLTGYAVHLPSTGWFSDKPGRRISSLFSLRGFHKKRLIVSCESSEST